MALCREYISDMDKWRNIQCLALIIGMVILGAIIGLGKVMKDSSYGEDIVLLGLANALNNFSKPDQQPPLIK